MKNQRDEETKDEINEQKKTSREEWILAATTVAMTLVSLMKLLHE